MTFCILHPFIPNLYRLWSRNSNIASNAEKAEYPRNSPWPAAATTVELKADELGKNCFEFAMRSGALSRMADVAMQSPPQKGTSRSIQYHY
jgi:hypothetical protein